MIVRMQARGVSKSRKVGLVIAQLFHILDYRLGYCPVAWPLP